MARELIERASLTTALSAYVLTQGWADITFKEGFDVESTVAVPLIAVHFLPSGKQTLQLGDTDQKLFKRVVQFDAYMENENRAGAIIDDLMDFAELVSVTLVDVVNNSTPIGSLTCQDNDSIYGETFAPNLTDVKVKRWRGIVRATYEAFYP